MSDDVRPRVQLLLIVALAAGALSGCASDPPAETPSPSASPAHRIRVGIVLSDADVAATRARLTAGDEPWATAWRVFLETRVGPALRDGPSVDPGPYRGDGDVHRAFLPLDADSRAARNLAVAYALSGDRRYAVRARDLLVAWANASTPTRLEHHDSPDTGQLQSWGAFSFAYAYDLTRESGVYDAADAAAVHDYFLRFTAALREALDRIAADAAIGTSLRREYEWTDTLTYRYEDRVIGGNFTLAIECALLALAAQTGDERTIAHVLDDEHNPLRARDAVRHALAPDNDGDGAGTRPVPELAVFRAHTQARGGTVDYMTYNARLATLLCQLSDALGRPLSATMQPQLRATWLYLSRFFEPQARPSPNADDVVDLQACLPRFVPAYRATREPRLLAVLRATDRGVLYEPQFLGPVTLTHSVAR